MPVSSPDPLGVRHASGDSDGSAHTVASFSYITCGLPPAVVVLELHQFTTAFGFGSSSSVAGSDSILVVCALCSLGLS
jgi:hypothetical protein